MRLDRLHVLAAVSIVALAATLAATAATAAEGDDMARKSDTRAAGPWNLKELAKPPKVYPAPGFAEKGVRAIFYEGLPWKGNPTRVFAWYGLPQRKAGEKVPAMVLVHGGGGTAFAEWVRLWTSRGYAAISMDTCGCTAGGMHGLRPRHNAGGPPGWGGYDQIDLPAEDQWMYHAVADGILATSLLASMPEVDADRIGITGISWGGILACTVAGLDSRLKFAAPVYGCGFLGNDPRSLNPQIADAAKRKKWLDLWDPSVYLPGARLPMLWVTGTNDFAFPLPNLQKSYRLPPGERTLAVRVAMAHGQEQGAAPEEIALLADRLLKGGPAPARITGQGANGAGAWATFKADRPVAKAELNYTCDKGAWKERKWKTVPADLDTAAGKVNAALPDGVTVYYFNLVDGAGRVVSTEHVER